MAITLGGEIGRQRRAKGWVLHRLEDEREVASGAYADALDAELDRLRAADVSNFHPVTRQHTLAQSLTRAQREAKVVGPEEWHQEPLAESVRQALERKK